MAVYKLFPLKDATLYSKYPAKNTGLDEIIECSTTYTNLDPNPEVSRILLQFEQEQIVDVINNKISGSNFEVSLKLFQAYISGLNKDTTLKIYPISQSWNMGTGRDANVPETQNGVCWGFTDYSGSTQWNLPGNGFNTTSSYEASNPGGGVWFFNSPINSSSLTSSYQFNYYNPLDLSADVTNIVNHWRSGSISNNGFIIKQDNSSEFVPSSSYDTEIKYFSRDTHTIYPPVLEFKWNDYSFNTGSSSQSIIGVNQIIVSILNNQGFYNENDVERFRINIKKLYPERVYSTSSLYLTDYYLPQNSYYAIKDLDTNEYIIDFDNDYTRISADSTGSYFDIYMNGLEPERYYSLLVKTTIAGSTTIIDDNNYFKITT